MLKKRILAIALTFCLLVSMMPTVYAAGNKMDFDIELSGTVQDMKTDDEITVDLYLRNNVGGLMALQWDLHFDNEYFSVKSGSGTSASAPTGMTAWSPSIKTDSITGGADTAGTACAEFSEVKVYSVIFVAKKDINTPVEFSVSDNSDGTYFGDETAYSAAYPGGLTGKTKQTVTVSIASPVAIAITAPVKGATPQATIAAGTGYTGTIEWEGAPAIFAENTPYTAKVTLTAATGYKFASDATAAVAGSTSITEKTVAADGSTLSFKVTFPATLGANPLQGTVTIDNTSPKYGQTLTAQTGSLNYNGEGAGTLSYQWYRGDTAISGANSSTYTLVEADVNQTIKVEVKNSNNSGSVTSAPTAAVAKADYSGSAATPATVTKTANSVTVTNVISGQEYVITTGSSAPDTGWVATSGTTCTFTGLSANTAYKVYTRVAATTTTNASAAVSTDVTTDKAAGSIVFADGSYDITYDGSPVEAGTSGKDLNYTYTGDGTVHVKWYNDNSNNKGTELGSAPTNAGIYWIGVSADAGTNTAAVAEVTHQFTITPKDISGVIITFGTQAEYDGYSHDVVITSVKDGSLSLTKDTDYTLGAGSSATNVESKTLTINGIGNYQGSAVSADNWSLVPKEVTLTWENYSARTYGDGKTVTATVSNKVGTDEVNVTVSGGDATAVGTGYTATATGLTGAQSGNYKLPATAPTQAYEIGKATYSETVKADFEVLYSDTAEKTVAPSDFNLPSDIANASFKDTATGKTGDDVIQSFENTKFALKSGLTESNNGNTASWTVTIQSDNYGDITAAVNVKVIKKHLNTTTLAVSQDDFTYSVGAAAPVVSNKPATAGAVTFSYSGRSGTTYGPDSAAPTDAGDYTVTARCEDSEYIYTATDNFTINKKSIEGAEVTLGTALTYNGGNQTQNVTKVELSGVDITSSCEVSNNVQANAGSYQLTATAKDDSNYTGSVNKDFTIARKAITPTIAVTGTYTYTGSPITPTFTVKDGSDVLTADDYTAVVTDNTNVGNGTITVTEKTTGNYTFSETQQNFAIGKGTYGDQTTTGSAKYGATGSVDLNSYLKDGYVIGTITKTNESIFESNPSMEGTSLKFTFKDVSSNAGQTAEITVPVTSTNFNDYSIKVTVTVNAKIVPDVTAPKAVSGLTYNGTAQALINAGSTTGGEMQYSLTSGSGYSTTIPTAVNAGTYTVYYKVVGNDDYADVAESSVSVTIAKKDVTVKPKDFTITKGNAIPVFALEYIGLVGSDTLAIEHGPEFICVNGDGTPVSTDPPAGTYIITWKNAGDATFTGAGNYNVTKTATGTLTINNPAPSGGGGGGVTTYSITVDSAKNGTITVSPKSAAKGTAITLTVEPDKGYTLETLTVTDGSGKEVKLTEKDGKYTFTMPASKVTVKATFMEDNSMLNFFVDVPADAYYYDAVLWAAENGITGGVDDTHFAPNATCTRAQAVTFLWRAAGSPAPKSGVNPFTDVKAGSYYYVAVLWAVENGITDGTSATTFSPDAPCSRAQIVTFLWRSQKSPVSDSVNPFTDVAADSYYANAVVWAAENGITGGIGGGLFGPDNDCTRAQIVAFLYRFFVK